MQDIISFVNEQICWEEVSPHYHDCHDPPHAVCVGFLDEKSPPRRLAADTRADLWKSKTRGRDMSEERSLWRSLASRHLHIGFRRLANAWNTEVDSEAEIPGISNIKICLTEQVVELCEWMFLFQEFRIEPPKLCERKGFEPSFIDRFAAPKIEWELPIVNLLEPCLFGGA